MNQANWLMSSCIHQNDSEPAMSNSNGEQLLLRVTKLALLKKTKEKTWQFLFQNGVSFKTRTKNVFKNNNLPSLNYILSTQMYKEPQIFSNSAFESDGREI